MMMAMLSVGLAGRHVDADAGVVALLSVKFAGKRGVVVSVVMVAVVSVELAGKPRDE